VDRAASRRDPSQGATPDTHVLTDSGARIRISQLRCGVLRLSCKQPKVLNDKRSHSLPKHSLSLLATLLFRPSLLNRIVDAEDEVGVFGGKAPESKEDEDRVGLGRGKVKLGDCLKAR
jgi:hypothetical protein